MLRKSQIAKGKPLRSSLTSAPLIMPSHLENMVLSTSVVTTQNLAKPSNLAAFFRSKKLCIVAHPRARSLFFFCSFIKLQLQHQGILLHKVAHRCAVDVVFSLELLLVSPVDVAVGMEELEERQRSELLQRNNLELAMIAPIPDGINVGFVLWPLQEDLGIGESPIHGFP